MRPRTKKVSTRAIVDMLTKQRRGRALGFIEDARRQLADWERAIRAGTTTNAGRPSLESVLVERAHWDAFVDTVSDLDTPPLPLEGSRLRIPEAPVPDDLHTRGKAFAEDLRCVMTCHEASLHLMAIPGIDSAMVLTLNGTEVELEAADAEVVSIRYSDYPRDSRDYTGES